MRTALPLPLNISLRWLVCLSLTRQLTSLFGSAAAFLAWVDTILLRATDRWHLSLVQMDTISVCGTDGLFLYLLLHRWKLSLCFFADWCYYGFFWGGDGGGGETTVSDHSVWDHLFNSYLYPIKFLDIKKSCVTCTQQEQSTRKSFP